MVILTAKRAPYFCVKTEFKLSPERNGQMKWSKLVVSNVGYLTKEQLVDVMKVRNQVDERVKRAPVEQPEPEAEEPIPANF